MNKNIKKEIKKILREQKKIKRFSQNKIDLLDESLMHLAEYTPREHDKRWTKYTIMNHIIKMWGLPLEVAIITQYIQLLLKEKGVLGD